MNKNLKLISASVITGIVVLILTYSIFNVMGGLVTGVIGETVITNDTQVYSIGVSSIDDIRNSQSSLSKMQDLLSELYE